MPLVYALGNRGAEFLFERFGIPRRRIEWTAKNGSVKRLFLEHAVAVADVMVRLEVGCRESNAVRLVSANALLLRVPEERRARRVPFAWRVRVRDGSVSRTIGIVPDKVFGLQAAGPPDPETLHIFVEVDRATMPVVRSNWERTSFFKKLVAYRASWQQGLFNQLFNFRRCIVLSITTSPERVAHLVEANKRIGSGNGSRLFLFADLPTVLAHGNPLTLPLVNGCGETTSLQNLLLDQASGISQR